MKLLKRIFRSQENNLVVCFRVQNYAEMCQRDAKAILKLEHNLVESGAISAKIDVPSKLCCVTITDPTVKPEDIRQVLETLGSRVMPEIREA
ncbi:hypothetical protein [Chloroflexus sp.]|uniref:hypothetical protein n=1 Tax=Chloroflexus sp. TaxID=1904827 RepID=UPI002620165E|nr:hypothetical protein [uncultured Chloroflexus sp.]